MKRKSFYHIVLTTLCLLWETAAFAQQSLHSGYFMEGFFYRHQLNPAFAPERNYISFPVLGNMNLQTQANIGVDNFLYPYRDNKLTTFMNPDIDGGQFLNGLKDRNRINANIHLTILSAGFYAWGGFNTLELNVKSNTGISLPYELFDFMKTGMVGDQTRYHMDNIGIYTNNYAELALGHSRRINDKLRVGGKLKFLLGIGNADIKMTDVDINMGKDKWMIQANGEMNTSIKGLYIPTKEESKRKIEQESERDLVDWDNIDFDSPGLSGFGMAIDLGATYKIREDLTLSAALLDFGFISWKNTIKAATSNQPWEFDGFQNIAVDSELGDDDPNSLDSQLDNLGDELEDYASFHRQSVNGKRTDMLGATLNIGAEYVFPYYDKLKFGLLSSTRIKGKYSWTEGRLSANVAPLKWFEAGVNYGISNFGSSFGWILNFHPARFNFFVGMDHLMGKLTPQFFPVGKANMNFSMGINVPFGKKQN